MASTRELNPVLRSRGGRSGSGSDAGELTKDKMNNTAGSYALMGSKVARDAHVVETAPTEWYGSRSLNMPGNWCARRGFAKLSFTFSPIN